MIGCTSLLVAFMGLSVAQNLEHVNFLEGYNSEALLAKVITKGIQWRLQQEVAKYSRKTPIISPIEDPLIIPELIDTPVDINIPEIARIFGNLFIGEMEVAGLSGLVDDLKLSIVVIPMSVNWTMSLPNATISGPFNINGTIESPLVGTPYDIEGTGDVIGSVEDVFFRVNAVGRAPAFGNMELQFLDVDLGFQNLAFAFEGLELNGIPFELSFIAEFIQYIFDTLWTDITRPIVNEMVRCCLNNTVARCNIQDLIKGYWDCLELTLNPKCFWEGVDEPTTTTLVSSTVTDGSSIGSTTEESSVTTSNWDETTAETESSIFTDSSSIGTTTEKNHVTTSTSVESTAATESSSTDNNSVSTIKPTTDIIVSTSDDGLDPTSTLSTDETSPEQKGGAGSMSNFNLLYIIACFFACSMLNYMQ